MRENIIKLKEDKFIKISILLILIAIILGAFSSHKLNNYLSLEEINSFQTGIRYQMFHAIALLILSLNKHAFNSKLRISLILMVLGTIFFSFSIYLLNIQNILAINLKFLGPITPIGGLLLLLSWSNLFFIIKKNN